MWVREGEILHHALSGRFNLLVESRFLLDSGVLSSSSSSRDWRKSAAMCAYKRDQEEEEEE